LKYLLDTCVVSDFFKGEKGTLERFLEIDSNDLSISDISVMEVIFGLELNHAAQQRLEQPFYELLQRIHRAPFDPDAARESGRIRACLKKNGNPVGPYDLLIAGTAMAGNFILITANTEEFERVEGLRLENWRS